ncbi:MAG: zinc-ribbon domain-containing protein [Methanomassiliicoccaceae archaeon]|nr:zinc-ribbon domain-containing protein [Methanomassiliicoccaceae archaeon]
MNDRPSYCSKCGSQLYESDSFCVRCGAKIDAQTTSAPVNVQQGSEKRSTKLWIIFALGIIWAVIAIYSGIDAIINAQSSIDMIDIGTWEALGLDPQLLIDMVKAIGVVFIISGILSLITSILVYARRYHTIALVACIIGSILALIALVGIIGLIVAVFLNGSKNEFKRSGS